MLQHVAVIHNQGFSDFYFCTIVNNNYNCFTGNYEAMLHYNQILESWHELRENDDSSQINIKTNIHVQPTEKIIQEFFNQVE